MSTPQGLPPGFKPSIPQTVPLSAADPERQKLYSGLAQAAADLEKPLDDMKTAELSSTWPPGQQTPQPEPSGGRPETGPPPQSNDEPVVEFSDEDKKEFVRSILSNRPYEKVYTLFGTMKALFGDRSPEETEQIYAHLDKLVTDKKIATEEEWLVELERARLAVELRDIKVPNMQTSIPNGDIPNRCSQLRMYPRPMYEALMECCRDFERHIDRMITKANDSSFWQTGGAV